MADPNRAWRFMRKPLLAGALVGAQVFRAVHRPDLPSLTDQDPSTRFENEDLPPITVVFLGDSTVTAPGVTPLDDSWARQVAIHLSSRFSVDLVSVAAGGAKARDVLDDQVGRALAVDPDLAYVAVGANDAMRMTPVARFESEMDRIVGTLDAALPAVGVAGVGDIGTIPRLPALAAGVARVRARSLDRAIARVVARHPRTRKSNAWGERWLPFETDPDAWAPDLFHASGKGHALYAGAAIPVVDELLELSPPVGRGGSAGSSR